jgi:hypothetical protein
MEPKGSILLAYFVGDDSDSMRLNIDELNAGPASLHDALRRESFAAAGSKDWPPGMDTGAATSGFLASLTPSIV